MHACDAGSGSAFAPLRHLAENFGDKRKKAILTVDDWEGLRGRARAIKDETLLELDTYLEQFAANAETPGQRSIGLAMPQRPAELFSS